MKEHLINSENGFLTEEVSLGHGLPFDDLFHTYSKKIYGVAKSFYLNHEDSEEIVQEVFIKLWNNINKLDPDQSVNSYVITVTKNSILNFLRSKSVRQNYLLEQTYSKPPGKNHVEDFIFFNDLISKLNQCVQSLPPQRRKIFKMVFFDGHSADKVSLKLSLSKRTVEHHIYSANKFIRDQLKSICS